MVKNNIIGACKDMKKQIIINFGNIVNELNDRNLKLCFINNGFIHLQDEKNNIYKMETYYLGSYLDKLIESNTVVMFELLDSLMAKNIEEWQKDIWGISELESFIKNIIKL